MRVLITADAEIPVPPALYGGIERIIHSLVSRFRALGHHVGLAAHENSSLNTDGFFPWPGATSTKRSDSFRNAMTLRRAVQEFQPDVLHSFSRLFWLLPLLADGHPKIMSYQREPTGWTVSLSRWLHHTKLQFTGCSRYICEQGQRRAGGRWAAIPNFVDPANYTFVPQVADDAPLVFLSRIERIKGAHNAIGIARKSGRRLLIAGNVVDHGEGARYWRQEIKPLLGRDGIEFVGPVNDRQKNELLGRAAALVVPIEWNEPFGIVFTEALACGTPVISCPRGALPEIVRQGQEGFLVNDVEQGAAAVNHLQSISRAACRERVLKEFSAEVAAARYLALYSAILSSAHRVN